MTATTTGIGPRMTTSSNGSTRAKAPVENFEGIAKGPGWSSWRKATHADLIRQAEAMNNAANFLKSRIIKSSKWPYGLNKRVAARRVTRPLFKASELLYQAASCMAVAGKEYNASFKSADPKRDEFDPAGAR